MAKIRVGNAVVFSLVVALATATLGCGDDGGSLDQFVGTWEYTQSDGTFACTGLTPSSVGFSGRKIWGAGVSSDLVDLTDNCNYRFDVKNKDATIQPMQACTFTNGDKEIPTNWRFSLLSSITAEEVTSTTLDGTTCVFTVNSTLKKLSKD